MGLKSLSSKVFGGGAGEDGKIGTGVARRGMLISKLVYLINQVDLRNQYVQFKISDIHIPDPLLVLYKLHGEDLLQGRVIDMSDSGMQRETFAVVEVEGLEQLIIVPVNRILPGE